MKNKLNTLGLARRARALITGTDMVVDGIRDGSVKLVILANDSGINTLKKINDKSKTYNVDIIDSFNSKELSDAIGSLNVHVIGITNEGFAKNLKK